LTQLGAKERLGQAMHDSRIDPDSAFVVALANDLPIAPTVVERAFDRLPVA